MENHIANTSCIILSAGSSQRMGEHKALLKFDAHRTFIQQITETYIKAGVEQILVVVNNEIAELSKNGLLHLSEKVELIINDHPEFGRFYSLQKGVQRLIPNNYCFFQNIDNPFVTVKVLENLIKYKHEADVLIPVFENRPGHPVLFSPFVVQKIIENSEYGMRIDQFLKRHKVKNIEIADSGILANINSQDEYHAAGFHF